MHDYGTFSILPPVLAIILTLITKQLYVALIFGTWFVWLIINDWDVATGTFVTIESFVNVFKSSGNNRTIMFSALLLFIQYSYGVEGFMKSINRFTIRMESQQNIQSRTFVQLLVFSISEVSDKLGTGIYVATETKVISSMASASDHIWTMSTHNCLMYCLSGELQLFYT